MKRKLKLCFSSNSGFTLVELLTSLTIFAFFSVALLNYMVTASSVTSKVSSSVNLSLQSQVALGMIEEYMVDCSGLVDFYTDTIDGKEYKVLDIVNNNEYGSYVQAGTTDDTKAVLYRFLFELPDTGKSNGVLYFVESEVNKEPITADVPYIDASGNATDALGDPLMREIVTGYNYSVGSSTLNTAIGQKELLSMNMSTFDVVLQEESIHLSGSVAEGTDVYKDVVTGVQVFFDMSLERETYHGDTFISLRNNPYNKSLNIITGEVT